MPWRIDQADAVRLPLSDQSVDLVFGSPPYCDARTYGIGAQRDCEEWIDWMLEVTREAVRVSRGLVLWVCAGVTRDHCYWPACEGLLYRWWAQGGQCWRPAYWHRVGIPGSGGKQWLRADVEYVLAMKSGPGPILWADNKINGHPPKWAPGGDMSHRLGNGRRVNQWGKSPTQTSGAPRLPDGRRITQSIRPSHRIIQIQNGAGRIITCGGEREGEQQNYIPPAKANPGTLIQGIITGGGHLGHKLAHENEAPFPLKLAEWFIRGWCPPGGKVCDPFSGSGTTCHAAYNLGRDAHCFDLRVNQVLLGRRRMREVENASTPALSAV